MSTLGCPRGAEELELAAAGGQEVTDHGAAGGGPLRAKAELVLAPQREGLFIYPPRDERWHR